MTFRPAPSLFVLGVAGWVIVGLLAWAIVAMWKL
jgi:hypothetical protein